VFRALRLFRVFKLMKDFRTLRNIMRSMLNADSRQANDEEG
jgi:hypothetical protein